MDKLKEVKCKLLNIIDMLVVETADMLHVPLFTAESLLRDNGYSYLYISKELINMKI